MTVVEIKEINYPSITIVFDNGTISTIDMVDYFSEVDNPLIEKILKNEASFNTVSVEFGALVWYDVGFNPDEMFEWVQKRAHKTSAKLLQTLRNLVRKS